jgi:hypothetical protein
VLPWEYSAEIECFPSLSTKKQVPNDFQVSGHRLEGTSEPGNGEALDDLPADVSTAFNADPAALPGEHFDGIFSGHAKRVMVILGFHVKVMSPTPPKSRHPV